MLTSFRGIRMTVICVIISNARCSNGINITQMITIFLCMVPVYYLDLNGSEFNQLYFMA